jgi:hypothetical protein
VDVDPARAVENHSAGRPNAVSPARQYELHELPGVGLHLGGEFAEGDFVGVGVPHYALRPPEPATQSLFTRDRLDRGDRGDRRQSERCKDASAVHEHMYITGGYSSHLLRRHLPRCLVRGGAQAALLRLVVVGVEVRRQQSLILERARLPALEHHATKDTGRPRAVRRTWRAACAHSKWIYPKSIEP